MDPLNAMVKFIKDDFPKHAIKDVGRVLVFALIVVTVACILSAAVSVYVPTGFTGAFATILIGFLGSIRVLTQLMSSAEE